MLATLKSALLASRPFSWINTAFPFVAGWLITGTAVSWHFWAATLFFFIPYNVAMYGINDIYDYESDLKNPRKASIEGALLDPSKFRGLCVCVVLFCVPLGIVLLSFGSLTAKLILLFSAFMVIAYSAPPFRFKEVPFLDSFTSSCHFVTPLMYGIAVSDGNLARVAPILIAYAMWGMASHAFGAVQDVTFDRQGGIASVATVIGARATVFLSTVLYLGASATIALAFPMVLGYGAALSCGLYALNVGRFWNITDVNSPKTNAGWRLFLALNGQAGAYVTGMWLYTLGKVPLWTPFAISAITFAFLAAILRRHTS